MCLVAETLPRFSSQESHRAAGDTAMGLIAGSGNNGTVERSKSVRNIKISEVKLTEAEIEAAVEVLRSGNLRQGEQCEAFEREAWR